MNEYLAGCCYADLFRRVRGKPETKAERLVIDQAAMLALPAESFEARRVEQRGANSRSLVRFVNADRKGARAPIEKGRTLGLKLLADLSLVHRLAA